ncbi:Cytochrome c oxidase copper chaperone, partial [Stegodyphus mimosarum]
KQHGTSLNCIGCVSRIKYRFYVTMPGEEEQPKKLKPCCACPETRKARDACLVEKG